MRRISRSCHKEYIEWARECTANQVYPMSIATGTQDGEIYTGGDCVLFWHYSGFAYISGNVRPDILDEIYRKFLASDTERRSEPLDPKRRFLLITDSEFILDYYSGADLIQIDKRIEYIYGGIPENIPILDESFALETITADNIGEIRGRITPSFSWKDSDSFLQNGFGFIARSKEDGCFAAVAFSSAISPEEVDIGVETTAAYRHHGLASYLAYRMCMEIIQQGRKPVWAHAETNTGSQKTALSVGFKPIVINMVIHKC
ncbi:GNAT family N-acetyltransferase [Butyrivibrio sp. LC3010]|uniref:GNAT family N-acetyltransferase n=1 Tax=Butyrivibrio sp. LC3010 TaxID=1280680 RepID=UPI00040F009A|nr:GNAT family N-acetyltransferase [Butyrivibrio sp. LC3010]